MTINKVFNADIVDKITSGENAAALVNDQKRALNQAIDVINNVKEASDIITGTDTVQANYSPAALNGAVKDIAVAQYAGRTAMKAATGLTAGDVVYLSEGGRSGTFEYLVGDYSAEVAADTLEGVYVKLDAVAATVGVLKRRLNGYVTPEMFGVNPVAAADAFDCALSLGMKVLCNPGATYLVERGITKSDINVDIDLNGSTIINTSASERMFIFEYPYLNIENATVDTANRTATLSDASEYYEGARVKIVSADRAIGNRPAPGDGRNYWQAQTLTVDEVSGNVVTFREDFEEDFTFSTTPKAMIFSSKSCEIYNGRMYSEKGFASTRTNGILRVKGGSSHVAAFHVDNANNTAVEFQGCDTPVCIKSAIRNIGRITDTSSSHGYSFISCNSPTVFNCNFSRTRHGMTNNDTPTQYADNNYYEMGPTYDMKVSLCHNSGDLAGAYSTHHGVRRAEFCNNSVFGSSIGTGIRGRDVSIRGLKTDKVGKPVFVYSESGMATIDKTTRWFVDGVESTNTTGPQDLQIQECQFGTLGTNVFKGGAPNGWFLNNGGTVALQGNNEFYSDATFNLDDNFLHTVNTNVENFGTLSIDIDSMTVNGNNNVIRSTSDKFFKSHGKILIEEPSGMDNIFRHIGTGAVLIEHARYTNNIGFPYLYSGTDIRLKGRTYDGSGGTAYQVKTASASYNLGINNSIDESVNIVLLTNSGVHTLATVVDGKFSGQRLTIRVVDSTGSNGFIVPTLSNLTVNGADITIGDGEIRSFVWSETQWVIESRNY